MVQKSKSLQTDNKKKSENNEVGYEMPLCKRGSQTPVGQQGTIQVMKGQLSQAERIPSKSNEKKTVMAHNITKPLNLP